MPISMVSMAKSANNLIEGLVKHWSGHPVQAAKDVLGVDLDKPQKIVLQSRWVTSTEIDVMSRGTGKTFLNAVTGVLMAILMPGMRVGFIGPSFRQSKKIFGEVEDLWEQSDLFQQSTVKPPTRTPDVCYVKFKGSMGRPGSYIAALPLGADGAKIRGERFYVVFADEAAYIDSGVLNTVVRGFLATASNPMNRVRRMRELKLMVQRGEIKESDIELPSANKFILSSTAYYQYNHLWERVSNMMDTILDPYKKALRHKKPTDEFFIRGKSLNENQIPHRCIANKKRALNAFTWKDMSEGFIDSEQVEQAKIDMSDYEYRMEYECSRPETEIITADGIKPIFEIQVGDLVLTHRGRFRHVLSTSRRWWDGKMVALKTYGYNRVVHTTYNHRFFTHNGKWKFAEDTNQKTTLVRLSELSGLVEINIADYITDYVEMVVNGQKYLYPRPSQMKHGKYSHEKVGTLTKPYKSCVPATIKLNYEFGLIVGYYAAEGSVSARGKQSTFSLDGHTDKPLQSLVQELSKAIEMVFGRKPKENLVGENLINVNINSRLVTQLLKKICPGVAATKQIDPQILYSNPEFMRGVLVGFWHGDGNIHSKPSAMAGNTGRNLLSQLRIVLTWFGFASSLRDTKPKRKANIRGHICECDPVTGLEMKGETARQFDQFINGNASVTTPVVRPDLATGKHIFVNDGQVQFDVKSHHIYPYTGYVHNMSVDEDASYAFPNATVKNSYFPPDSEGFFRRSILDGARSHMEFGPIMSPREGCVYCMGIDPARQSDNFAVSIGEVDTDVRIIRLARVFAWNKKDFPHMHLEVRKLIEDYNIEWIKMDAGGGGTAMRDLMADKNSCPAGQKLILENDFEDHKTFVGKRILAKLTEFSNYTWVHDANFNLLSALQHGKFQIPATPPVGNELWTPAIEDADQEIEKALLEWSSVITIPSGTRLRWDTPTKRMRKDRYSSILLMADAGFELLERQGKVESLPLGFWA